MNNCNLQRSYVIFFIIFIVSCKQNPSTTPPIEFESFPKKTYVRDILEKIDWSKYVTNMGAPNVGGKSIIIKAYTDMKKKLCIGVEF